MTDRPPSVEAPVPEQPRREYARIAETPFWRSFHYAFSGILYATRTQPNMRIHLLIAAMVLILTMALRLERIYVIAIALTITFVLAFELLNTAVESIVDLLTASHHPLAQSAKDAAAGGVLIASAGAVGVGYLVFYTGIQQGGPRVYSAAASVPANVVLIILAVVAIAAIFVKVFIGGGTPFQGGAVSGHTALAFAAATGLALYIPRPLVAVLAYFIAFLAAQSRVEARIHNAFEVTWGALLGGLLALAIYLLTRPHGVL